MRVAVLNGFKMNYDGKLDYKSLSDEVDIYDDTTAEQLIDRLQGVEVAVTKEMPVGADLIEAFPDSVKCICEAGTGYNNIDMEAARKKGLIVCNIPAYSSERVAHTAIMLMLNLSSSMGAQIRMLERGDRSNFTKYLQLPHVELNGKTLGMIGSGNIGSQVAAVAVALGMKVLIYKRNPGADTDSIRYTTLEEVLSQSDYVSLHCPLSDATRHIIDAQALKKMKKTAFVINTSRGALIDEPALIEALQRGEIAGAGLDVQESEPPAQDNPLYDMENVILTPHMGWKGEETRQRLLSILKGNIEGYRNNKPVNVVS